MTLVKKHSFGINKFYRRQTVKSKYTHFEGPDEDLLKAVEQNFPLRKEGRREGAWVVSLAGTIGQNSFFTPVVKVHRYMILNAECLSRSSGDQSLVCASGIGHKVISQYAQVILYSADLLKELDQRCTKCDFEVVSIHGSDVPDQPDHPYDLARQVLQEGKQIDPRAICEAILYWGTHVYAKAEFTRHVDKDIADLISQGNADKAIVLRQKRCPDETPDAAADYVNLVGRFIHDTGKYYQ